ncbi:unnamed protein product [Schistosoma curassoni]|uniref:CUB domain-containing protein n=1 Tax=Schistosoma curassoni TaxID=6186 RepID=A0A183JR16_9TREM|nr:unnamed protein product [Schistosoma curassoni]
MNLEFKGDRTSDVTKNRVTAVTKITIYAAKLQIKFTNGNLFSVSVKDKLPRLVASMYICQFTCSCGAGYIGHSQCLSSTRIIEHFPVWFYKSERKALRYSILEHLIDSDHSTYPLIDFMIFADFELESHQQCTYDQVIAYDGPTNSSAFLGQYCGSRKPGPIISSQNQLLLTFNSDSSVQRHNIIYTLLFGVIKLRVNFIYKYKTRIFNISSHFQIILHCAINKN